MDPFNAGALSLLPPIIAITLALWTKEVFSSLMIGILSGSLIYTVGMGQDFVIVRTIETAFAVMVKKVDFNIIIFCTLLGSLVYVISLAGGTRAYGKWATRRIKGKTSALLSTSALGAFIFIDDYFNCLTVGTVMRPVTDSYKISRAKLAYIIDATAAPICIIAPISSWAAAVGSNLKATGAFESDLAAFVATIPWNFYALLSIIMVVLISACNFDFGPMRKAELRAQAGDVGESDKKDDAHKQPEASMRGHVLDMLIPIAALIVFAIAALLVAFIQFVPRGVLSLKAFMDGCMQGMKAMMPANTILVLAWAISGVCRDLLQTPVFVKSLVEADGGLTGGLLPAIIFILAGFLSFSTGTAWGTFGILIPIVVPVAQVIDPNGSLVLISLSATLAGSVFGDHCSPISDTTILSSAGAACTHIEHVSTQMPYACVVAVSSLVGYIVAGFSQSLPVSFGAGLVVMVLTLLYFRSRARSREAAA